MLTEAEIERHILELFPGTVARNAYAERMIFYNPDHLLPMGIYFATLKNQDGPNDKASNLNRPGVFRLWFSMRPHRFIERFGMRPARPAKGGVCETGYDYTALEVFMPHPCYGWANGAAINSPAEYQWDEICSYLYESYEEVQKKFLKKTTAQNK